MGKQDDHPTPGVWEVGVWEKHVFVHGGPNNDDIADFHFCDEDTVKITKDEAIANAVLFAASKDLLAALKTIVHNYDTGNYQAIDMPAARAALDKASVMP